MLAPSLSEAKSFSVVIPTSLPKAVSISVIIPTADRPELVRRAVESVLCQAVLPCEIVVVDNGYRDCELEIASRIVRVKRTAPRVGPSAARNIGVNEARGTYVAFLDDDDFWTPTYLGEVARCLAETDADAVLGCLMRKPINGALRPYKCLTSDERARRSVFYSNPGVQGTNLTIRRDVFLSLGGFDERMRASEDRDLFARLMAAGRHIAAWPQAISIACDHSGVRASSNLVAGNWRFIRKHWRSMRGRELARALRVVLRRHLALARARIDEKWLNA